MKALHGWLAAAMLVFAAPAIAATMMAPAYPGATPDRVASAHAGHARVYLSRDAVAQVRDWYEKRLANRSAAACPDADEGCGTFTRHCGSASRDDGIVQCDELLVLKWNDIPPGASMVDAYNAGVRLISWQRQRPAPEPSPAGANPGPPATGQAAAMLAQIDALQRQTEQAGKQQTRRESRQAGVDLSKLTQIPDMPFGGLKREVMTHRHTEKELEAVYRRYRGLTTAVYPSVEGPDGAVSYERQAYSECRAKLETPRTYLQGTEGADSWKPWLACLQRIAAHAYRTRIVIDTGP